jgi:hypothetical protein
LPARPRTGVEGTTEIDLDILPPDIGIAFPYWTEGSRSHSLGASREIPSEVW